MVVQTRFFSCRFSISHAKQRPTTAPRRAARVRAAAFRRAHGPTLGSRRHKMRVRRQHKAPTALTRAPLRRQVLLEQYTLPGQVSSRAESRYG